MASCVTWTGNKIGTIGIDPNYTNKITADIVDYIDLLYQILGIDINYREWQAMSKGDRLSFARDLKIKKILSE